MKWPYWSRHWKENTVFSTKLRLFFLGALLFSCCCLSNDSASTYFNQAQEFWEKNQTAPAVEKLLLASWHRKNPLRTFQDLTLLKQIQRSLLKHPSPTEELSFQIPFFFNQNLKLIWICSLFWLLVTGVFLLWRLKSKVWGTSLLFFSLGWFSLGLFAFYFSNHQAGSLFVLQGESGAVPVRSSLENSPDLKIQELPEGLIVQGKKENETAIWIEKPLSGWIDRAYLRQVLLQPRR